MVLLSHGKTFYAFPPFICIPRVLQKVLHDKAVGILVVTDWPNQFWYTECTEMITKEVILPSRPGLLILLAPLNVLHPLHRSLQLQSAFILGKKL